MIKYRNGNEIDYIRLIEMFSEAGWEDKTKDFNRLVSMVESSEMVVTAWDFDYMIGFANIICDEDLNGQVKNLVVDLEYEGADIAKGLINNIIWHNRFEMLFLEPENKDTESLYKSLGFKPREGILVYQRTE